MSGTLGRRTRKLLSRTPLKKIVKRASNVVDDIKDYSLEVSSNTLGTASRIVREFNDAIPALKYIGFSITKFSVEIGVTPDIGATLTGSVRALNPKKIKEMIQKRSQNRPLKALLHALLISANLKDDLRGMGIKGIEINITLGLPTVVNVDLLA